MISHIQVRNKKFKKFFNTLKRAFFKHFGQKTYVKNHNFRSFEIISGNFKSYINKNDHGSRLSDQFRKNHVSKIHKMDYLKMFIKQKKQNKCSENFRLFS